MIFILNDGGKPNQPLYINYAKMKYLFWKRLENVTVGNLTITTKLKCVSLNTQCLTPLYLNILMELVLIKYWKKNSTGKDWFFLLRHFKNKCLLFKFIISVFQMRFSMKESLLLPLQTLLEWRCAILVIKMWHMDILLLTISATNMFKIGASCSFLLLLHYNLKLFCLSNKALCSL